MTIPSTADTSIVASPEISAPASVLSGLRHAGQIGLVCGAAIVYAAAVGLLTLMQTRWIMVDVLTLSWVFLITLVVFGGFKAAGYGAGSPAVELLKGTVAGVVAGAVVAGLLLALSAFSLRSIFIALSPDLRRFLSVGAELGLSVALWMMFGGACGAVGAVFRLMPRIVRQAGVTAWACVVTIGALQQLMLVIIQRFPALDPIRAALFTWEGLTWQGASVIGALCLAARLAWLHVGSFKIGVHPRLSADRRDGLRVGILILFLAVLPALAGAYIGQVLMLVGLYVLMGMGLNIEVGLAGLLDLGFVAFFAVGAYATALLTADSPFALASYTSFPSLSFWQAMPVAVLLSVLFGIVFGIPVLGIRGDYLAIATLGLGEIVRVIVLSDMAAPLLGGAEGVLHIPKPWIGPKELHDPADLFYLTLACSLIAAYTAWRLQHSPLGRAWVALRDDEDVAQALGINLVRSKLLAYGLGAAFAGLAGSIFATMLTSVYPNSFTLQVSINVLALTVIGGSGSIQGVVLGSILLVGLPELFREFGEYRFLLYGLALVVVMIKRPNGLWSPASAQNVPAGAGT